MADKSHQEGQALLELQEKLDMSNAMMNMVGLDCNTIRTWRRRMKISSLPAVKEPAAESGYQYQTDTANAGRAWYHARRRADVQASRKIVSHRAFTVGSCIVEQGCSRAC